MLEVASLQAEPVLFAILGFLFGIGSNLIVDKVRNRRREIALVELMHTEGKAFVDACKVAIQHHSLASSNVRRLAILIQERYSREPERWIVCRSKQARKATSDFYLECSALLDLIDIVDKQQTDAAHSTSNALGPSNYEGMIGRIEDFLLLLECQSRK